MNSHLYSLNDMEQSSRALDLTHIPCCDGFVTARRGRDFGSFLDAGVGYRADAGLQTVDWPKPPSFIFENNMDVDKYWTAYTGNVCPLT